MSKTLYLECFSGISGDMSVAALLDLGASKEVLKKALDSLPVTGFETKITRVKKAGLDVCDFDVILDQDNHDHDMEYLHGHDHHHDHDHYHDSEHHHDHEHHHEHHHDHVHRGLPEILHIIAHGDMTPRAKEIATNIFEIIGDAEAKAHGVSKDEVHFHEVGAVDSIVDIVAVAVCLDNLGIEEVIVPELYEGKGFVRCQHGMMPIPVPAVSNIVTAHHLQLHPTDVEGELVTPTGAAIVAAIRTKDVLPKKYSVEKIGVGAGKRQYERPSLLRAMIIKDETKKEDVIYKLETNIDDVTGENLGYVMELLFEAGARDVNFHPVFMKKNRPAYQLNVICSKEDVDALEYLIFKETTTIGIRKIAMERSVLEREEKEIETKFGVAKVKICKIGDLAKCYPEYESVKKLCKQHKMSFDDMYQALKGCWK